MFTVPSDAIRAFKELDGTDLQGRLMHIIAGEEKRVGKDEDLEGKTLKQRREIERRRIAGRGGDWGTLFMNVISSSKTISNVISKTQYYHHWRRDMVLQNQISCLTQIQVQQIQQSKL